MKQRVELAKTSVSSFVRVSQDRKEVLKNMADPATLDKLKQMVRPNSIASTMKKAGTALLIAPDPVTGVPGAVLLGASFVMKRNEPSSIESVFRETRKILAELRPLM